jgi:hypothetical protein
LRGQILQRGFLGRQISLPKRIKFKWRERKSAGGRLASNSWEISFGERLFPNMPNLFTMRLIWVSTGKAGLPNEKRRTQEAVLSPTPGSDTRYSLALSKGKSLRNDRLRDPLSPFILRKISFILLAFIFDIPPHLIADSISPIGAFKRISQLGKRFLRLANAL